MQLLSRSRPLRHQVQPHHLAVNWGHPLAPGLLRAYAFGVATQHMVTELSWKDIALQAISGTLVHDLPGTVWKATSNQYLEIPDAPDLTPVMGQGYTILVYAKVDTLGANQLVNKAQLGSYEYFFGTFSSGVLYGGIYGSNSNTTYIARLGTVAPTAAVWHTWALTWDGVGDANANHLKLVVDGLRIDDTEVGAGGIVAVSDTGSPVQFGGTTGFLGGTNTLSLSLVYLWARCLLPDELAWLADDPYAFLTVPSQGAAFQGDTAGQPATRRLGGVLYTPQAVHLPRRRLGVF